jgi:hypothetical protein
MNEVWFAKQCANINETLYIAIWTNAPLPSTSYQALFYMTKLHIYKFNMKVAMEKWKARKEGQDHSHIVLIEPTWVHKPNPHYVPIEWLLK